MRESVEKMITDDHAPTADFDDFVADYMEDDNIWWRTACGHHMNLFEEAIDRLGMWPPETYEYEENKHMNETEIAAAVAEQEEYIKRYSSCGGISGKSHRHAETEELRPDGITVRWTQCIYCGVTETRHDYATKITGRRTS